MRAVCEPTAHRIASTAEVVWQNADTDIHSIISTGDLFPSSATFASGESYAVVFTEPGTYEYTRGVHPFMTGTIIVA
jgi:plastocyanin